MTINYINKELRRFYLLFIIYVTILLISWLIFLMNSELLLVPIAITGLIIYLFSKKFSEYRYWNNILSKYNNGELKKFIDEEYSLIQNVKGFQESNKVSQTITGNRIDLQYRTQKDVYMTSSKFNKVKILLELKKSLEFDRNKLEEQKQGEIY